MSSNKQHDTRLLIRTIRPELFRFILIEYDLFPAIQNIQSLLTEAYPERSVLRLSTLDKSYREIMDSIYAQEKGIILIEDFENILANEDKYIPFNQRRDKLAQYPIALIAFVPAGYHHIQTCMKRMADLWSFRSLTLNWTYTKIDTTHNAETISGFISENYSSLNELEYAAKEKELNRLEKQLAETEVKPENLDLIDAVYLNVLYLLLSTNKYAEYLQMVQSFLTIAEKYQYEDKKPIIYAEIYECLGIATEKSEKNYTQALSFFQKALEIRKEILGEKHLDVATVYSNIGNLYYDYGNYEQALFYYKKVLKIKEKIVDYYSLDLAIVYNKIGMIYYQQKKYSQSIIYCQKVLKIREKVLGENHKSLIIAYSNIGLVYHKQGNYPKALLFYQKGITIYETTITDDDLSLATLYNNIGLLYNDLKNYQEALPYYQKSILIREKKLNKDNLELATSYNNIALLYYNQENYTKALAYQKLAVEIMENVLPPTHPDRIIIEKNYQDYLSKQEK